MRKSGNGFEHRQALRGAGGGGQAWELSLLKVSAPRSPSLRPACGSSPSVALYQSPPAQNVPPQGTQRVPLWGLRQLLTSHESWAPPARGEDSRTVAQVSRVALGSEGRPAPSPVPEAPHSRSCSLPSGCLSSSLAASPRPCSCLILRPPSSWHPISSRPPFSTAQPQTKQSKTQSRPETPTISGRALLPGALPVPAAWCLPRATPAALATPEAPWVGGPRLPLRLHCGQSCGFIHPKLACSLAST